MADIDDRKPAAKESEFSDPSAKAQNDRLLAQASGNRSYANVAGVKSRQDLTEEEKKKNKEAYERLMLESLLEDINRQIEELEKRIAELLVEKKRILEDQSLALLRFEQLGGETELERLKKRHEDQTLTLEERQKLIELEAVHEKIHQCHDNLCAVNDELDEKIQKIKELKEQQDELRAQARSDNLNIQSGMAENINSIGVLLQKRGQEEEISPSDASPDSYKNSAIKNLEEAQALLQKMRDTQRESVVAFKELEENLNSYTGKDFEAHKEKIFELAEMHQYSGQELEDMDGEIARLEERIKLHQLQVKYGDHMQEQATLLKEGKISFKDLDIPYELREQMDEAFKTDTASGTDNIFQMAREMSAEYGLSAEYIDGLREEYKSAQLTLQARADIINSLADEQRGIEKTLEQEKIIIVNGRVVFEDAERPGSYYSLAGHDGREYIDNPELLVEIHNKLEGEYRPSNLNHGPSVQHHLTGLAIDEHTKAYERDIKNFQDAEENLEDAQQETNSEDQHDIPAPRPDPHLQKITDNKSEMIARISNGEISEDKLKEMAAEYGIPESHFERLKQSLVALEPNLRITEGTMIPGTPGAPVIFGGTGFRLAIADTDPETPVIAGLGPLRPYAASQDEPAVRGCKDAANKVFAPASPEKAMEIKPEPQMQLAFKAPSLITPAA